MIEFKCACAMANILNRTLVLPLMGHRSETSDRDWDFSFRITEFHWLPIEKYLDVSKFSQLPCQIISTENFRSLYATEPDFSLGELHFNPVAKATSEQQLEEYYKTVLGFNFDSIKSHQRLYQLTDKDVINEFSGYKDRVLGMGTLFWIYGFGKTQNYPLEKYENYMHVLLYKKIVGAISVSENLRGVVDVAESYLKQLVPNPIYVNGFGVLKIGYGVAKIAGTVSTAVVGSGGDDDGSLIPSRNGNTLSQVIAQIKQLELSSPNQEFYAIHVRRGDYWNKCKRIQNEVLRNHCYPPADTIYQVVDNAIQIRQKTTSTPSSSSAASSSSSLSSTTKRPTIYIATNIGGDRSEFAGLIAKYRVVFFEDIFMADEKDSFMDSNEMAFLDIELCSRAALFIGNFYSSFSRTIFEMREIKNLDYLTF